MIPCLYDSREMKFDHNGIGKLADAQSCTVTEKRNGSYELKLICPADGIHAEMLEEGNIVPAIFRKSRVKRHFGNTHRTISTPRT